MRLCLCYRFFIRLDLLTLSSDCSSFAALLTKEIPKEVACRLNIPSTDWWDYSLASSASLARTEYDEQSHDVCILFKHGCKKFLLKTGLEVA